MYPFVSRSGECSQSELSVLSPVAFACIVSIIVSCGYRALLNAESIFRNTLSSILITNGIATD